MACWILLHQKLQRWLVVERVSRQLQRKYEDGHWKNNWVLVAGKRLQAESFYQNLQNKPVVREETFLQTFLINHVEQFLVPTFCGSFYKSWRKVPVVDVVFSSHEKKTFILSIDLMKTEYCLKFKRIGTTMLTWDRRKWKRVQRLGKSGGGSGAVRARARSSSSSRYSCTQRICTQCFPVNKFTPTISKFKTLMDCMRTIIRFPTTSGGNLWIQGSFHLQGARQLRIF